MSDKRSGRADSDEEAPPGHQSVVQNGSTMLSPISRAVQDQRRWIEKPNSLCFGLGNVTILTVAIELPKVLLFSMCLGCVNVQFG